MLKDWTRLEHWARQWILLLPGTPTGFKWLARAAFAQNKLSKAAYAYGRLLDLEPSNEEGKKFFADYPSSVPEASGTGAAKAGPAQGGAGGGPIQPQKRQIDSEARDFRHRRTPFVR